MQQSIYKYQLQFTSEFEIQMPSNASILKVAIHGDVLTAWALVRGDQEQTRRRFRVLGTCWETDYETSPSGYIDTIFLPNGLVWHVFDMGEPDRGG